MLNNTVDVLRPWWIFKASCLSTIPDYSYMRALFGFGITLVWIWSFCVLLFAFFFLRVFFCVLLFCILSWYHIGATSDNVKYEIWGKGVDGNSYQGVCQCHIIEDAFFSTLISVNACYKWSNSISHSWRNHVFVKHILRKSQKNGTLD